MPGRPHLSPTTKRCVEHVKGKVDNAYAVCIAGQQKAGKSPYVKASKGGKK